MPSRPTKVRPPAAAAPPNLHAALYIGAGSVSLLIAELDAEGGIEPVDFLEMPVPLAHDVFLLGNIRAATIEQIVAIVGGFQRSLADLGLDPRQPTRAVATNILTESANHEHLIHRIRIACGIAVDIVDDGEMTRLIYLKTRRRLRQVPKLRRRNTLVVHVGPGNTRALLFKDGLISRYTHYRLGVRRTREALEASHADGPALLRVIREHISSQLVQLQLDYADVKPSGLVLVGYEIQAVAKPLNRGKDACGVSRLRQFTTEAANLSEVEAVKRFQIDYQTAGALLPSLEINLAIAEGFGLPQVHIPTSEYERGLLQDLLFTSTLAGGFATEVLRSARILAERYHSDPHHGNHVAALCERFFTALTDLHQLTEHDALLLQVAAILHEVGTYISPRAHHKHSQYIIVNSEIFGLGRDDVTLVALVARYHRHATPQPDHPTYSALSTADRIRVCKMAAILRVADALERTHHQRVAEIEIHREPSKLRLRLPGLADAAVERLAMAAKADLFEQTFGLAVSIDESQ